MSTDWKPEAKRIVEALDRYVTNKTSTSPGSEPFEIKAREKLIEELEMAFYHLALYRPTDDD